MVFTPPAWVPQLPFDPPDSIPLHEFWSSERYGRQPLARSRNPYTCGVTGKTYTATEMTERYQLLARSLAKRLGWRANEETPWDKVVGLFSFNSIDFMMSTFAVHRLSGIVTPANAMYSATELEHQLKSSGAKALFTCIPLLETALKASRACSIPDDKVFILQLPGQFDPVPFKSLDDLIEEGKSLPELEPLIWSKGQGARQVAYLCYSSGTSGLPKAVMIAHRNVIANVMQIRWHDDKGRKMKGVETQVQLGLLPFSHIYGLVVIAQAGTYRGDETIILPKFELTALLETIQRFKIQFIHIVPPIVIQMIRNPQLCSKYDLSSLRFVYTGAAPLGAETHEEMVKAFPFLQVGQGYGMTETSTVVASTGENDVLVGTSGSLAPACRAKLIGEDGQEITEYDKRGELWVQSPAVTLGYLNNERATSEAYVWDQDGRWMRTGDIAIVTKSPSGYEHISVVDRLKELIKVKGHQVAPAELEAHLLSHPDVNDCTVIPVPDEGSGEVPKAFVVKSAMATSKPDAEVSREINRWVEDHKARYKWLKGGIEFIDVIPKSPSGKILRRLLKDKEREKRRANGAKL
ncbi:acetyl-CoA synthetase-like protein [Annulohypoxylon maeteangense]|uniref:acetyl-CoA synthetase-like protein n=1 Tax=Annulohypoxylon maeteangense TaxID=1927788 RepID=UPI0020084123|nr:acetyl-CoA synthetase-like protein [Annulohypoxylon maeteangense]KAI0883664.1 acetyl-CoA synthetase-like protein [Annulohypoxylon maeteangense]